MKKKCFLFIIIISLGTVYLLISLYHTQKYLEEKDYFIGELEIEIQQLKEILSLNSVYIGEKLDCNKFEVNSEISVFVRIPPYTCETCITTFISNLNNYGVKYGIHFNFLIDSTSINYVNQFVKVFGAYKSIIVINQEYIPLSDYDMYRAPYIIILDEKLIIRSIYFPKYSNISPETYLKEVMNDNKAI